MRKVQRPWTESEIATLRAKYARTVNAELMRELNRTERGVYAMAHKLGLSKDPAHIAEIARQRTLDITHGGAKYRFKPGHPSWNKGAPGSTGLHPNSAAHHFKRGHPGHKHNEKPLGTLRIGPDRLLERKVAMVGSRRWQPIHRLVWEAANGPVPAGHIVVFKPGLKSTQIEHITLDAVELITRAENLRRNSVQRFGKAISGLIQLRGALIRQINKRARKESE